MTSSVLQKLYASGGAEIRIPCLVFGSAAWANGVFLCQGWTDITATLAGTTRNFVACDFAAQLAARNTDGVQGLQFALDPRESDALDRIDQAIEAGEKVYVSYLEYLASDLSEPARPVETFTVISYSYDEPVLTFTASFHDLVNKAYPRNRYTVDQFPGLKYVG
jgi:hypothetical protein